MCYNTKLSTLGTNDVLQLAKKNLIFRSLVLDLSDELSFSRDINIFGHNLFSGVICSVHVSENLENFVKMLKNQFI